MSSRPLSKYKAEDLRKLCNAAPADQKLIMRVLSELEHRKTRAAKQLAASLKQRLVNSEGGASDRFDLGSAPGVIGSRLPSEVTQLSTSTPPSCPRCGSPMSRKLARRGRYKGRYFYGCSTYPVCTSIVNIQQQPTPDTATAQPTSRASPDALQEEPGHPHSDVGAAPEDVKKKVEIPLSDRQKEQLELLRDRFLDITSNNRSIRLNRIYDKWAFDLSSLNQFGIDVSNDIVESALRRELSIPILPRPVGDQQVRAAQAASRRLTNLYRNITDIEKEKGLYDLNIGFPFLTGLSTSGKYFQAPILLVPVRLHRGKPRHGSPYWTLTQDLDQPITFNKTLLIGLAKFNNTTIDEAILDIEILDELYGTANFIEWMAATLKNFGLHCDIDAEAFDDEIDQLPQFTLADLTNDLTPGEMTVRQNAILGHFPQYSSSILNDYIHFLEIGQEDLDSIIPFLETDLLDDKSAITAAISSDFSVSDDAVDVPIRSIDHRPEKNNVFLLPSDSSQDRILLKLDDDSTKGLVVWGPPGTGKSQTIVNMIGDRLSKGKTVLVVCQKRAALDVVHDRLEKLGLAPFIALVHHSRQDRKDLYRRIDSTLQLLGDSSDINESFETISETIGEQTTRLNGVVEALAEERTNGWSLYDIYLQNNIDIPSNFDLPGWFQKLVKGDLLESANRLSDIFHRSQKVGFGNPWDARLSFAKLGQQEKKRITKCLTILANSKKLWHSQNSIAVLRSLSESADPLNDLQYTDISAGLPDAFIRTCRNYYGFRGMRKYLSGRFWRARSSWKKICRQYFDVWRIAESGPIKAMRKYVQSSQIKRMINDGRGGNLDREEIMLLLASCQEHFQDFVAIDRCLEELNLHERKVVDQLKQMAVSDDQARADWGRVLISAIQRRLEDEISANVPVVNEIVAGEIDELRERYRENLEDKFGQTARWLVRQLKNAHRIFATENRKVISRLVNQVNKKRNIPSIRNLNDQLLPLGYHQFTVPCWLVSPETVSDIFPCEPNLFDLVIFDEASQCPVENALPSIFRAKQIVIAGDEKQLPPLKLFTSSEGVQDDQHADSEALESPSILNLARSVSDYGSELLEWHYRSKHEELINFSNHAFYHGRIKISPNSRTFTKSSISHMEWCRVEGYWEERANEVEAREVLRHIRQALKSDVQPTIGVITFNVSQKNLILDLIDETSTVDDEFRELLTQNEERPTDEQLFVKNIENVQGDERDLIIFSIGYAPPHPGGRVMQQFGSLNKLGGENRLNVAVSRAIEKIIIVTSIDPSDLDVSRSLHDGPRLFQKYLDYAQAVSNRDVGRVEHILHELSADTGLRQNGAQLDFDSPFEQEVFGELRSRGYDVHSQVGQSGFRIDLAIVDPDDPTRYILGIECDGARFHSSDSARERDVFRQKFLERRGWTIHRIWSTNWWHDKNNEIHRIQSLIRKSPNSESRIVGDTVPI